MSDHLVQVTLKYFTDRFDFVGFSVSLPQGSTGFMGESNVIDSKEINCTVWAGKSSWGVGQFVETRALPPLLIFLVGLLPKIYVLTSEKKYDEKCEFNTLLMLLSLKIAILNLQLKKNHRSLDDLKIIWKKNGCFHKNMQKQGTGPKSSLLCYASPGQSNTVSSL